MVLLRSLSPHRIFCVFARDKQFSNGIITRSGAVRAKPGCEIISKCVDTPILVTTNSDSVDLCIEDYFRYLFMNCEKSQFWRLASQCLLAIDNSRIADNANALIKTPFGICDILHCSTGCKAAILSAWHLYTCTPYVLSLTSAGRNACDYIFRQAAVAPHDSLVYYMRSATVSSDVNNIVFHNIVTNAKGTCLEVL